jgi:hypothetical protein
MTVIDVAALNESIFCANTKKLLALQSITLAADL